MINTGQVCNCAERVYVERSVHNAFIDKLKTLMEGTRYGDPSVETGLDMGPLVNRAGLDRVAQAVDRARADGASVITGGRIADRPSGYHYEPTLITCARADHDIMRSEIFGPVLPVQAVDGIDEAIALSNDSDYGLTSSIFTNDLNAALQASRELKFGETYINREHFEAMQATMPAAASPVSGVPTANMAYMSLRKRTSSTFKGVEVLSPRMPTRVRGDRI